MNKFRRLSTSFAVAPQLDAEDFKHAAVAGYRCIVNNRPDGEAPGCLQHQEAAALADEVGLDYVYLPVGHAGLSREQVALLQDAIQRSEGPVLAYCRSGTRSSMLWALAMAGALEAGALIDAGAKAGYDFEPIRPLLITLGKQHDAP